MKQKGIKINVGSEIGELEAVILHTPGVEVESMTPENANRALYSDILNLSVASREYEQLNSVLNLLTNTYQIGSLLTDVLQNEKVKEKLIVKICNNEKTPQLKHFLMELDVVSLSNQLIEGVVLKKNSLTNYLSNDRYALRPLHNFFYTRDPAVVINNNALISRMASYVRNRESIIMTAIYDYHPLFSSKTILLKCGECFDQQITIEGGDVLVAREDILLIGMGARTTSKAIDSLVEFFKEKKINKHIMVQELPEAPESFIHLDMVFTLLDKNKCMVFEPVILNDNHYRTIHIEVNNGQVSSITDEKNLLTALDKLGMNLEPIFCGGRTDSWIQEREQWHSGANFFALAPGKVIGYGRNVYTIEELNKHGFSVLKACDVINGEVNLADHKSYVITIEGSELSRGGGGCRCMTQPVSRKKVD